MRIVEIFDDESFLIQFYLFGQNISIAVVGKNEKFHILNDEETAFYVAAVEKRPPGPPDADFGGVAAPIDDAVREDEGPEDPQVAVAMDTR